MRHEKGEESAHIKIVSLILFLYSCDAIILETFLGEVFRTYLNPVSFNFSIVIQSFFAIRFCSVHRWIHMQSWGCSISLHYFVFNSNQTIWPKVFTKWHKRTLNEHSESWQINHECISAAYHWFSLPLIQKEKRQMIIIEKWTFINRQTERTMLKSGRCTKEIHQKVFNHFYLQSINNNVIKVH